MKKENPILKDIDAILKDHAMSVKTVKLVSVAPSISSMYIMSEAELEERNLKQNEEKRTSGNKSKQKS